MLSKLVTAGTTLITNPARVGRYYGARLMNSPSAVTLTMHDTSSTTSFAEANQIDKIWGGTAAGTLQPTITAFLPDQGVGFFSGLVSWLPTGGSAHVFYE